MYFSRMKVYMVLTKNQGAVTYYKTLENLDELPNTSDAFDISDLLHACIVGQNLSATEAQQINNSSICNLDLHRQWLW